MAIEPGMADLEHGLGSRHTDWPLLGLYPRERRDSFSRPLQPILADPPQGIMQVGCSSREVCRGLDNHCPGCLAEEIHHPEFAIVGSNYPKR